MTDTTNVGYTELLNSLVQKVGLTVSQARAAIARTCEWVEPTGEYGKVAWTVGDVQSLFDVSDEEAEDFLVANAKYVQEAMTERGWDAMQNCGELDGLKKKEPD